MNDISLAILMSSSAYQSCRCIQINRCLLTFRSYRTRFQQRSYHGDDAMPAHGTIAFIVHEKDTEVSLGCHFLSQHSSIHITMPSRLPHQCLSNMIVVLLHISAPLQYRCTW